VFVVGAFNCFFSKIHKNTFAQQPTLATDTNEESEADAQVDEPSIRKKKSTGKGKKVEQQQHHPPSVVSKVRTDNHVSNSDIQITAHVDGININDDDN